MGILFFMCSSPSAVHSSPEIWELAHKTRCLWEDQYPSMLPRKKLFSFFSVNNKSPGVAWQLQSVPQHIFPSLIHVSWQSLGDTSEKWTLSNLILNLLIPGEDAKGSNSGQSPQRTTPRCYLSPQPLLLAAAPRGPHQLPATAVTLASWMTAVRAACHTSTTQTKPCGGESLSSSHTCCRHQLPCPTWRALNPFNDLSWHPTVILGGQLPEFQGAVQGKFCACPQSV